MENTCSCFKLAYNGYQIYTVLNTKLIDMENLEIREKLSDGTLRELCISDVIHSFIDEIFEKDDLFIQFFEKLQSKLDWIDDKQIEKMIETLSYWNKEEDFSKMDKLTILYRYRYTQFYISLKI